MPSSVVIVRPVSGGRASDGLGPEAAWAIGGVPVSGRFLGAPLIELVLHNVQDAGVGADEGREVLSLHHQSPDHVQCDDGGRTHAHLQRAPLAHQLTQAAYGQHAFAAIFIDADLGPAAEDDHDVIRPLAFFHQPGTGRERPPGGHRPERFTLDRVKDVPEAGGMIVPMGLQQGGLLLLQQVREEANRRCLRTIGNVGRTRSVGAGFVMEHGDLFCRCGHVLGIVGPFGPRYLKLQLETTAPERQPHLTASLGWSWMRGIVRRLTEGIKQSGKPAEQVHTSSFPNIGRRSRCRTRASFLRFALRSLFADDFARYCYI